MSDKSKLEISVRANVIGIIVGAALALLFAVTNNPGLMGVGAAIGMTITMALDQYRQERQ